MSKLLRRQVRQQDSVLDLDLVFNLNSLFSMEWVVLSFSLVALILLAFSLGVRHFKKSPEERWREKYDQKVKKFYQWY